MNSKKTPEIVKEKIKELKDKKKAQLDEIQRKINEESATATAAAAAMDAATDALDVDAYEAAKAAQLRAQTALDMCAARRNKIQAQKMITEKESDVIINSLVEYERKIADEFQATASGLLEKLRSALEEYEKDLADAEGTLGTWTSEIHANYIATMTTYADGSHRAPQPVRVSRIGTSDAAKITREYIEKMQRAK